MRDPLPTILECGRSFDGPVATPFNSGPNGLFFVKGPSGATLRIIASAARPQANVFWEHVSVSIVGVKRTPYWREMCVVKDLFWNPEEAVMQLHPPESEYVNNNLYVLHLWRYTKEELPRPPATMVGFKELGVLTKQQSIDLWNAQHGGKT